MAGPAFDTLAYARRMEAVGFSRDQAEAMAQEQAKLLDERLATKTDLEALRLAVGKDVEALKLAVGRDIEALRLAVGKDVEALRLAVGKDVEALRLAVGRDIKVLRVATKADLAETRADILKWMIGTIGVQTIVILGAVVALARVLPH